MTSSLSPGQGRGAVKDRTLDAVRRQLAAMGCQRYQIGIRDAETGQMMDRTWTAAEVETNLPWLKRLNAKGNDIYVRPAEGEAHGLVLVDDIDGVTLGDMRERGINASCCVETSPKNLQAWVKLENAAEAEIRSEIGRVLAKEFGADPNSADHRHYGRLAGFTNRKPQHLVDGRGFPYVLCHEADGQPARESAKLKTMAVESLDIRERQREQASRVNEALRQPSYPGRDPAKRYRREIQVIAARESGQRLDWSRVDWMVAKSMAKDAFSAEQIKTAMLTASPGLAERKKGHQEDYAARTVAKAMQDPDVVKARQERQAQALTRDSGLSM